MNNYMPNGAFVSNVRPRSRPKGRASSLILVHIMGFMNFMMMRLCDSRPFVTMTGELGMTATKGLKPEFGDEIVLLTGCCIPFIVRRVEENGDRYGLRGCCYSNGWMDADTQDTAFAELEPVDFSLI
jgi:hypothetical protein